MQANFNTMYKDYTFNELYKVLNNLETKKEEYKKEINVLMENGKSITFSRKKIIDSLNALDFNLKILICKKNIIEDEINKINSIVSTYKRNKDVRNLENLSDYEKEYVKEILYSDCEKLRDEINVDANIKKQEELRNLEILLLNLDKEKRKKLIYHQHM